MQSIPVHSRLRLRHQRATWTSRDGRVLHVNRLTEADIGALQRFNAELSERTRGVFLPHAYDEATLMRCVERNRRSQDRAYVLRYETDVVGYFFLWELDQSVPVLGIGLADAWQGHGLGEPMLRLLIGDACAAGCSAIELTTVPTNRRALQLYLRVGFKPVDEVDNIACDGRVVCEHRMFLPLKPGARPTSRTFKPPGA